MGRPSREDVVEHGVEADPQIVAHGHGHMGVDLGRGEASVSEEHLHDANVGTLLQKMAGEAVSLMPRAA